MLGWSPPLYNTVHRLEDSHHLVVETENDDFTLHSLNADSIG